MSAPPRPLPCASPTPGRPRRRRAVTEGIELGALYRLATDQRVFTRRARRTGRSGGTVLVDVSGSMSLDAGDLAQFTAATPAATVAVYCGTDDAGELRIVARDGYRVDPRHLTLPGHGNIVDLPALEWLARQPGPRLWVSDGAVTGCDDQGSQQLKARCTHVCRRAGIRRVEELAEATRALGGRPSPPRSGRRRSGRGRR